jgi:hypothetical protein
MRRVITVVTAAVLLCACAQAAAITAPYSGNYTLVNLGAVTNVTAPYGGIAFLDNNTLLLGGSANNSSGAIYEATVTRGAGNNITSIGPATLFATANDIDGGLAFGPGGDLFFTEYPNNQIGEILPGGSSPAYTSPDLTGVGVTSSVGTLTFIPAGFNGAGSFVIGSYSGGAFCTAPLTPDGTVTGAFDIGTCTGNGTNVGGGPEGIIYVPQGSTDFSGQNVLVSQYGDGQISVFAIDSNGLPTGTGTAFITGLTGAEGAVVDPLTGDFLFSTFGGGNQVYEVQGFSNPGSGTPEPGTFFLMAGGLAAVFAARRRRA